MLQTGTARPILKREGAGANSIAQLWRNGGRQGVGWLQRPSVLDVISLYQSYRPISKGSNYTQDIKLLDLPEINNGDTFRWPYLY